MSFESIESQCGDDHLILPIFRGDILSKNGYAVIYLLGLLYCFLGIAIIADIFMGAIEVITSKTKKVKLFIAVDGGEEDEQGTEIRVWNDTVANLTLMALGSSAPEILLSCIEIVGNKFEAGELGPGTIVGSAAFNLLCIIGFCIMAIPSPDIRRINDIRVFAVTAIFSLFAYIWVCIVLRAITPDIVDIWEAIVTLACFPLLVIIAYLTDTGCCGCIKKEPDYEESEKGIPITDTLLPLSKNSKEAEKKRKVVKVFKKLNKFEGLSTDDKALLTAFRMQEEENHSRMWYRIGAVRNVTGGKKLQPQLSFKLQSVYDLINSIEETPNVNLPAPVDNTKSIIEFSATSKKVMENDKYVEVSVIRRGNLLNKASVRVLTIEGSANAGSDYKHVDETLIFAPYEEEKKVKVEIVDDDIWEPDEVFFIKLYLPDNNVDDNIQLGKQAVITITIVDNDKPGQLTFEKRGYLFKESLASIFITVKREYGCDGNVSVEYETKGKSAKPGQHFHHKTGILTFEHEEAEKNIEINIINSEQDNSGSTHFEIELSNPTQGAKLGKYKKTMVTLTSDEDYASVFNKIQHQATLISMRVSSESWLEQIRNAVNVNGGDIENASTMDYFMHVCTFGWKIIFSLVPPPSLGGGWPCFVISLMLVGALTAVVGDLAAIFGCLVGLKATVTAITFVALGTSLPDLFASKFAAVQEKYADNAVGNVTGSNSVNIFLGLGLPWTIAAIYHATQDSEFRVPADDLAFSVIVYTICALLALTLLLLRRYLTVFGQGELGGPTKPKYASAIFLFFLWFIYVIMSSLQAYGKISVNI